MILLIWDSCGQEELKLYEFPDDSDGARLAEACHGSYVNGSNGEELDKEGGSLDRLNNLLGGMIACDEDLPIKPMTIGSASAGFGPYSAIYISGFIP